MRSLALMGCGLDRQFGRHAPSIGVCFQEVTYRHGACGGVNREQVVLLLERLFYLDRHDSHHVLQTLSFIGVLQQLFGAVALSHILRKTIEVAK